MINSIIRNLISNAVKFTPRNGSITIYFKIINENNVEIFIQDTGIGMNEEFKTKLFKIDEQTSRTGTEGEASTGLGLLLCKEFVEKHGGIIKIESEEGKGSTFSFTMKHLQNQQE
jgi:signal transduction histidine kinase